MGSLGPYPHGKRKQEVPPHAALCTRFAHRPGGTHRDLPGQTGTTQTRKPYKTGLIGMDRDQSVRHLTPFKTAALESNGAQNAYPPGSGLSGDALS